MILSPIRCSGCRCILASPYPPPVGIHLHMILMIISSVYHKLKYVFTISYMFCCISYNYIEVGMGHLLHTRYLMGGGCGEIQDTRWIYEWWGVFPMSRFEEALPIYRYVPVAHPCSQPSASRPPYVRRSHV